MNSKLYDVLSALYEIERKLYTKDQNSLKYALNGSEVLLAGVDEYDNSPMQEGALRTLLTKLENLKNSSEASNTFDYETALSALQIINEGTDEEVAQFGLEHSNKTYCEIMEKNISGLVNVGYCTDLSRTADRDDILINWTDPEDVILNGTKLVEWDKTELWRCEGVEEPEYPGISGSVLIASTDKSSKNAYSSTPFRDQTVSAGTSYTYKLFSYTTAGNYNNSDANILPDPSGLTWPMLHKLSQAGSLLSFVSIGDEFTFNHDDYGEVPIILVNYNNNLEPHPANEIYKYAAIFQTKDLIDKLKFDTGEPLYALTEDTVVNSQIRYGNKFYINDQKYYYTFDGSSYTQIYPEFGSQIPENTYYEKNFSHNSNSDGTSIWAISNIRLWLNAETKTNWWTKQSLWDTCEYSNKNGFFVGIEESLKKSIIPISIYQNYSGYKTSILTSDKIFLPISEPCYWDYETENSKRIKKYNGSSNEYFSMAVRDSIAVYLIKTDGSPHYQGSCTKTLGIAPCFCI